MREIYSLATTVQPGNSGGPLLDTEGRVVGVIFAKSLEDDATGYALTLAEAKPVLEAGATASARSRHRRLRRRLTARVAPSRCRRARCRCRDHLDPKAHRCQSGCMQVSFVAADGIADHPAEALDGLLARQDGYVWVDLPDYDAAADDLLADVFHAHSLVRRHCAERNFVPTVHAYDSTSSSSSTRHSPVRVGTSTSSSSTRLIGDRYLVTVHGPRNPVVTVEEATEETRSVRERIVRGRLRPAGSHDLAYAIGSAIARRQSAAVRRWRVGCRPWRQQVLAADFHRPEELLEQLFLVRHELMTARTMAAQAHDIQAPYHVARGLRHRGRPAPRCRPRPWAACSSPGRHPWCTRRTRRGT